MKLDMQVGLGHTVLDGDDPAPPPLKKGGTSPPPIFGPCLLWPNGCMDQDDTWQGGRPQPRRHCVRWGPSSPHPKGHCPQFSAHVVAKRLDGSRCQLVSRYRPRPGPHCVRWGPSIAPSFRPMSIVVKRLPISATIEHLSFSLPHGDRRK